MTTIAAHIHEPAGVDRHAWPVTAGLPFAQGELRDPTRLGLRDAEGRALPAVARPLATWPDGSVKWALLDAQVDVSAQARRPFLVDTEAGGEAPRTPLRVTARGDAVDVVTGELALRVGGAGRRLLRAASRGRREFLRPDDDADLIAWSAGTPYLGQVEAATVEVCNPLRAVVHARGAFVAGGDRLMGWETRVTCYAGHSFVRLDVTVIHDEAHRSEVALQRLQLALATTTGVPCGALPGAPAEDDRFALGVELGAGQHLRLTQWNVGRHTLWTESEGGQTRLDRRRNAFGWLHVADAEGGVTLKLRRWWQSYPKQIAFGDGRLELDLYPDLTGFAPPRPEPGRRWHEIDPPCGVVYDGPLRWPQGMARSHEVYLRFGDALDQGSAVDRFAQAVEQPLLLELPSSRWGETGVFGPFPAFAEARWPLELRLRRLARPPNGRGLLDEGDQVRLERDADGHPATRTTQNLAGDLPRALLHQYLRAGDQRLFWEGEAAVRHLMDVDTVHFHDAHPEWVGGPCRPRSQNHHYTDTDEADLSGPSTGHVWLGALLDYHFLTGCPRARQVAGLCADYCRRAAPYAWKDDPTGADGGRDLGARAGATARLGRALTAMGTWYEAFPEDRFLPAMEALVDLLEAWQDDDGRWRERLGAHQGGAVPAALSGVLQGLQLYHRITGDRRARRLALDGAGWLARRGRTREGLFFDAESPLGDDPQAAAATLLGPLAWAYEEGGDAEVLEAGHRLFRWLVDAGEAPPCLLKDLLAFMPLLEDTGLLAPYELLDARCLADAGRLD